MSVNINQSCIQEILLLQIIGGIEKAAPEFDDNKGVSLVLVNNDIGEKFLEQVRKSIEWKKTKLEDSMQTPLKEPFSKPENREQFWKDFYKNYLHMLQRNMVDMD